MSKSGFFNEMGKISRQFDDFDRFVNKFCNFRVLIMNTKYQHYFFLFFLNMFVQLRKGYSLFV